jgi:glycosyltransferase involved in cell wall biosynthesis
MTWPSDVTAGEVVADAGVNYLAPEPGSGYGEAAEDYMTALRAAGVPVRWTPLAWGSDAWGPDHNVAPAAGAGFGSYRHGDICNAPIECDTMVVHSPPLWNEPWSQRQDVKRRVAYTTWETDRLPAGHVATLNRYDAVLVPSTHNRDAFRRSGVTAPLHLVPHVARPVPEVQGGQFSALGDDVFVFYVVNTWSARKALAETILAFVEAFTAADPVVLVVKTTAEDHVALGRIIRGIDTSPGRHAGLTWWTLAHLLAGRSRVPRIRLVPGELPRHVIDELHTRGDCFVSLTKGEGWGLGAFEAAAYGRPVVITG